jgi:hypothetical protein
MKFTAISTTLLITLLAGVFLTVAPRPTEIDRVSPTLIPSIRLGQQKPAGIYCEHSTSERPTYDNCVYGRDIYLVVERNIVTRVYMFMRKDQSIMVGQIINELGAPVDASYTRVGLIIMRWPNYMVGVSSKNNFSPASKVIFVGWGSLYDNFNFQSWRGFSGR